MKRLFKTHMWPPSVAFVMALTCASPGLSAPCDRVEALEAFALGDAPPEGATCSTFRGQAAGTAVSCHWEFPFRDVAAQQMAAALWTMLQSCRAGRPVAPDLRVNHPDSYELREWATGGATYRVSVKDKGGQNRTLVFFRRE